MDKEMEAIKEAIIRADFKLLDKLLTNQTPEFCSKALGLMIWHYWDSSSLANTPKPMPFDVADACETRSREILQMFLNHGANVNYVHENESIFSLACSNKSTANIVKMMIDHGADLSAKNKSGLLPIQVAFRSRDEDKMNLFLDRGISAEDINRLDLLQPAVETSTEIVKRLVQLGADVNHILEDIPPAIFGAVNFGNLVMVKFLIESGADLNITNRYGLPTLSTAVVNGNVEIVKVLLENGANANLDKNPLIVAIGILDLENDRLENRLEIIQLLLQYGVNVDGQQGGYNESPIFFAAIRGYEDIVKLLLDQGASEDERALILAIVNGHEKIVKMLLESGYDPNCKSLHEVFGSETTYTALTMAVFGKNKELVKLLLQYGANIDGEEEDSESPISAAASKGYEEIVMLLLDKGARQDDRALIYAINRKHEKIVKLLLERGYDPNCKIAETALCRAVSSDNRKIVKLLLDYGAQVDGEVEKDGVVTALISVAAYSFAQDIESVQLLLDYGADINKVYKEQTALAIAIMRGRCKLCERLLRHMILIKAQDLHVSEKNLNATKKFKKFEGYQKACEDEMDSLKNSKFDDSNLSYLDIFTIKDVQKLSSLANNQNIFKVLKSNDFKKEFPIYGEMIVKHFDKGAKRNQDFELLKRFINYLSTRNHDQLPKLPFTVVSEIFSCLNDNDFPALWKL